MATCKIISNSRMHGDYFRAVFDAPEIAPTSNPGQFVHIRIDNRLDTMLRRPFSIHNAENGRLTIVYKVVGKGTSALAGLPEGTLCDIIGPCGKGFSRPADDVIPVAVCGGYGAAATFMLTRQSKNGGVLLLGARSEKDLLLTGEYAQAGFQVKIATDDGSAGIKGRVTDLFPELLEEYKGKKLFFYGCGPHPMLMALARLLREKALDGELSVDHIMCCGVGACFGCVVKVNDHAHPGEWMYARSCADGPVFKLADIYTE
ncbi:MAG: dihydroorotate dehydrogenase electron transfer subunit [Lentisphaeria bacterium]|nr:dihydroorotate dehydrogenase electron transfer subunit [Lentisphaeria bacterium]